MRTSMFLILMALVALTNCQLLRDMEEPPQPDLSGDKYTMPGEDEPHEGTWLQWPHNHTYPGHAERHDVTFIAITKALHTGERVHIIVYDQGEEQRVQALLEQAQVDLTQIDFYQWKTDDYWVRDNGPIFTFDENEQLMVQDWGFNGWGEKAPFQNCDRIPTKVSERLILPMVPVSMINEGGSVEIDGHGTLMAKKSSILNNNRNPGLTQAGAEAYFRQYLGVTNFIWLEGKAGQEITDDHIDGTARFANAHTIVTYEEEESDPKEYRQLVEARNVAGQSYDIVELPLTRYRLPSSREYGIYINFYIGNEVVLVPNFEDPHDEIANARIQAIYPNRRVVGIPAIELGLDGGGVHCVTQQQPRVR